MFYHLELTKELELHPRHFGPRLKETLDEKLVAEVEGTCSGQHGFIICVTDTKELGKGHIREGTGFATFNVKYTCVVFRPFKGEVIDCTVTSVNKMGFFAEAGPLQVFVSNHLIPEDYSFNATDEPCFITQDEEVRIEASAQVRLRIVGARVDATEIFCVGTIEEDFLGVIAQQERPQP